MRRSAVLIPLALGACAAPVPASEPYYWKLISIDGVAFAANATLALDPSGTQAFGQGPCNTWTGDVITEPFPVWQIRNVEASERGCDDLAAEAAFFTAMQQMTQEAVGAGHLELLDQGGRAMKFVPVKP